MGGPGSGQKYEERKYVSYFWEHTGEQNCQNCWHMRQRYKGSRLWKCRRGQWILDSGEERFIKEPIWGYQYWNPSEFLMEKAYECKYYTEDCTE